MFVRSLSAIACALARPSWMPIRPLSINVEPNSACNLNCAMCDRERFFKKEHRIDAATFGLWYDQIRSPFVALHGYGEPLLNTDLFAMLEYAKSGGSRTTITSNFILLNGRADRLVASGLDLLKVSLDATDAPTYRRIRNADAFNAVVGNIGATVAARKARASGTPEIRINFTISRDNVHQVAAMVRLARSVGVQSVCFAPLLFKHSLLGDRNGVGDVDKEEFRRQVEFGITAGKATGCVTNLKSIRRDFRYHWRAYDRDDPEARPNRRRCLKPWITSFVSSNGDVKPCDLLGLTDAVMGNLNEQSFGEIWNGTRYRAFRKEIREGRRPTSVCADCFPMGIADFFEYRNVSNRYLKEK